MASEGDSRAQADAVAAVATKILGQNVLPSDLINESLLRATVEINSSNADHAASMRECVLHPEQAPTQFDDLRTNPLSSWLEATTRIRAEQTTGRLRRGRPRTVLGEDGVAFELANLTGVPRESAVTAIRENLLNGANARDPQAASRSSRFGCISSSAAATRCGPPLKTKPSGRSHFGVKDSGRETARERSIHWSFVVSADRPITGSNESAARETRFSARGCSLIDRPMRTASPATSIFLPRPPGRLPQD